MEPSLKRYVLIDLVCAVVCLIVVLVASGCQTMISIDAVALNEDTLLEIVPHGYYADIVPNAFWGTPKEVGFVNNYNVPQSVNALGGFDLNGTNSFLAVADGFMAGLANFRLSFWFSPKFDNPTGDWGTPNQNGGGCLAGSNWANPNPGDWLICFFIDGTLHVMTQNPTITRDLAGNTKMYKANQKYYVELRKTGTMLELFVDNNLEGSIEVEHEWLENGAPMSFGGNSFDRSEGMQYFNGSMGDIKIVRF